MDFSINYDVKKMAEAWVKNKSASIARNRDAEAAVYKARAKDHYHFAIQDIQQGGTGIDAEDVYVFFYLFIYLKIQELDVDRSSWCSGGVVRCGNFYLSTCSSCSSHLDIGQCSSPVPEVR